MSKLVAFGFVESSDFVHFLLMGIFTCFFQALLILQYVYAIVTATFQLQWSKFL